MVGKGPGRERLGSPLSKAKRAPAVCSAVAVAVGYLGAGFGSKDFVGPSWDSSRCLWEEGEPDLLPPPCQEGNPLPVPFPTRKTERCFLGGRECDTLWARQSNRRQGQFIAETLSGCSFPCSQAATLHAATGPLCRAEASTPPRAT